MEGGSSDSNLCPLLWYPLQRLSPNMLALLAAFLEQRPCCQVLKNGGD